LIGIVIALDTEDVVSANEEGCVETIRD
jgi:hypothetical protein